MFIPIIGEKEFNLLEESAGVIGQFIRQAGLGVNDCTTLFTVMAVRCARLAGASKEEYLNYTAKMWDEKSKLGNRRNPDGFPDGFDPENPLQ